MSPVTLEQIKSEHAKVAEMIAAFEAQSKIKIIRFPELEIELRPGEHYAGIITGRDGELSYHVILLSDKPTGDLNWKDATAMAEKIGGSLPTRREQSLLFANPKDQFEERYYWSCEEHASVSDSAWCQGFYLGSQGYYRKNYKLRARFVRRLEIL